MLAQSLFHFAVDYWPVLTIVAIVSWLVRNKFNNGLNQYPGPFLAAYTNWWRLYDAAKRNSQFTMIDLHKKHGDVVRLGPNVLSFSDPAVVKEIYGLNKGYTKTAYYPIQSSVQGGKRLYSLFTTRDEAYHARFRRCVANAYALSTLVSYEPLVDSTIDAFLAHTESRFARPGAPCDFSRWLQFFAFDVIGEITWSTRLGFIERCEDVDGVTGFITRFVEYANVVGQMPWLDLILDKNPVKMLLSRLGLTGGASALARFGQKRMDERACETADEKRARGAAADDSHDGAATPPRTGVDFLTRFYRAQQDHPDFMTDRQILAASISLITAGSDTTAISLSSIFHHLLRNPPALARLLAELHHATATGQLRPASHGPVRLSEAQSLPYLDACITEALRLHPAIGMLLERHVPAGGARLAGRHVAGGTIVGCNAWVLHRREEVFGEGVDEYRPERWLEGKGEGEAERVKRMRAALFTFGAGPRTCIGRNVSLLEMYKLVPTFLRRFEIEFVDASKPWKLINCWFVRQEEFRVRFKIRKSDEGELAATEE